MKVLAITFFLLSTLAYGESSRLIPLFVEAAEIYTSQEKASELLVLRKELKMILKVLDTHQVPPRLLKKVVSTKIDQNWPLRGDDQFDQWTIQKSTSSKKVPEVALHAVKVKVIEESDDYLNDDLYLYFFVTDGVVPTGKVTCIYKGLDEGDSFFLDEFDRLLYPALGVEAKMPHRHLIVDYGIMESDGDDIRALKRLSEVILDIAVSVYTLKDPEHSALVENLRKEVKALAGLLLEQDDDDRLITGSFGMKAEEIASLLEHQSYVEFSHRHAKRSTFGDYVYKMYYRLIKK